ncbi:hypothetical protein BpHYR1_019492 [Brachionus plicatilis]|uniref:Uncharacterized protein n=1 Tax=Brachionus plicatilis TaxID=10195 RepID=A0A3M7RC75_BRAPC|nr:hypothetical protein BpHYR1_019492 [Brachionus plicatilis]
MKKMSIKFKKLQTIRKKIVLVLKQNANFMNI